MKEYDYFVVVHRDAVVGGCIVRNMREGCHILRFFIGVDFQGKGFGRAALARIEREYPEAAAITLDVPDWDEEARGFCESLGYGRAGTTFHPDLTTLSISIGKSGETPEGNPYSDDSRIGSPTQLIPLPVR
jgi:GNAT superfamily N-acetyltransferase